MTFQGDVSARRKVSWSWVQFTWGDRRGDSSGRSRLVHYRTAAGLPRGGRLAIWVEGLGGDLGHLAAGGRGAPAEVGPVARGHARLPRPAADVAADRPPLGQLLDPPPEGVRRRHVFERLLRGQNRVADIGCRGRDF